MYNYYLYVQLLPLCTFFSRVDENKDNGNVEVIVENESALLAQKVCIVCDKFPQSGKKLFVSKSRVVYGNLKKQSQKYDNILLLAKLKIFKREKKLPAYHRSCYTAVVFDKEKSSGDRKKQKFLRDNAFHQINSIIDREIISNARCLNFSEMTSQFRQFLLDLYKANNFNIYKSFRYGKTLKKHVLKKYTKQIKFCLIEDKEFLCPANVTVFHSAKEVCLDDAYKTVTIDVREACLNVPVKKLPSLVTTKDLIEGECLELPEKVENFFKNILVDRSYREKHFDSERTK